ncbi:MAG: hypothetical protein ABIP79_06060 [Chitinophagaceae bacterium]
MRKIFFFFLIIVTISSAAQNKDYLLSLDGIGSLKLGMPLIELEKVLKTKITLKVIDVDPVVLTETIKAKYKGIDVEINLWKRQDYIAVDGISASSPLCKTKSGIGIGSTKLQIIAAYEGYHIDAKPLFEYEGDEKPKRIKTKSTVTVKEGEEGYAIIFNLVNNKVVSFDILPLYDDEE